MRRAFALTMAAGLLLLSAVPAVAAEGDAGSLMIMKHACTEEPIKTQADFDDVVAMADGDEVTALALTVLACPTIVLTDDEADFTDGIHGAGVDFDFSVTDSNGDTQTLSDAEFMPAKLCETDIDRDANGDGQKTADVCLDISHYIFSDLSVGDVTVKETTPPNGWKFGTVTLTPKVLQVSPSDDAATNMTFTAKTSTVKLDLSGDADNMAMIHVYNFEKSPATDTLSDDPASGLFPVLPVAGGLFAGILGLAYALRRRSAPLA